MDVDDRCDGEWDECQGSESRNKLLRQGEGRCVARVRHPCRNELRMRFPRGVDQPPISSEEKR